MIPIETKPMKAAIKDALLFTASNEDFRPILCAVKMTGDGTTLTLEATDSYRLLRRTVPSELVCSTLIDRDDLALMVASMGRAEAVMMESNEGGELRMENKALIVAKQVDGDFPNVDGLWAKQQAEGPADNEVFGIAPWVLGSLSRLSSGRLAPVKFMHYGPLKPIHFSVKMEDPGRLGSIEGLLMPVRL